MVWLVKVVWNQADSGAVDRCAPRQRRFAYVTVEGGDFADVEKAVRFHRRYRTADAVTVIGTWTDVVELLGELGAVVGGRAPKLRVEKAVRER
jgi:hypothetical protein